MSLEKINQNDALNVLGGVENNSGDGRKCELGINHFFDNYVISPSGFANAEHCKSFELKDVSTFEMLVKGKSRTGCKYCKHYING